MRLLLGSKEVGMKGNEEIKGQEGRKCDICNGRKNAREGKEKGGSIEKGLKHEGKKAGRKERWT